MRFESTNGRSPAVSLACAVASGPAPDAGLYTPTRLDPLPAAVVEDFRDASQTEIAVALSRHLLGDDLCEADLERIVTEALDFDVPLHEVSESLSCLELFHGPTLAFKDVGARFAARLLRHFRTDGDPELTILVATSGDTGAAVADAFHGLDGFRVVVLFPKGKISLEQQKLFTTLGGNVSSLAVDGVFDDCQRLVRAAFADDDLRGRRALASANSINVGRLLPQIFYYFFAAASAPLEPLLFSIPSGNFGNLTAGLMARRLGLPDARFVAATNVNDVALEFLENARFEPRDSIHTISNAMDVGNPSNLARIAHLYDGDPERIRRDLEAVRHTDEETRAAIRRVWRTHGYVVDPHSAIGYLGAEEARRPGEHGIFLATAHPAKFREVVETEIGSRIEAPPALTARLDAPELVVEMSTHYDDFHDYLSWMSR